MDRADQVGDPAPAVPPAEPVGQPAADPRIDLLPVVEHMSRAFDGHAAGWRHNPVVDAVGHSLRGRGKLVRAEVFLASCRAVGGDPQRLTAAATGIEYGHLASLVHDDLIDGDAIRRNEPSVWHHFGQSNAVVAGDWLLCAAFHALARCRDIVPADRIVSALHALAQSGIDMCFGAAFELTLTGDVRVTPEAYLRMAAAKTGSLLRAAAASGAVLGGGSAEQVGAAGAYGENLGIAFQIVDDLLPYTTEEATLGKPVCSDVRNRRPTLPVLFALERCAERERELLRASFSTGPDPTAGPIAEGRSASRSASRSEGAPNGDSEGGSESDSEERRTHRRLLEILVGTGALARARRVAEDYRAACLDALTALPDGGGRDHLHAITAAVLDRDR